MAPIVKKHKPAKIWNNKPRIDDTKVIEEQTDLRSPFKSDLIQIAKEQSARKMPSAT